MPAFRLSRGHEAKLALYRLNQSIDSSNQYAFAENLHAMEPSHIF
jgi:hypothetical protein